MCVCVRAAIFIHGPCVCGISLGATGERTGARRTRIKAERRRRTFSFFFYEINVEEGDPIHSRVGGNNNIRAISGNLGGSALARHHSCCYNSAAAAAAGLGIGEERETDERKTK